MSKKSNGNQPPLCDSSGANDEKYYFSDGNITLSANDIEGNVKYFRVHQGILRRHSPVFRDMLSLQPPAKQELHDGTPIVHLSDDAADLNDMLEAFYDPHLHFGDHSYLDPESVHIWGGALELATKYEIEWLRTTIIQVFEQDWPKTVAGWQKRKVATKKGNMEEQDMSPELVIEFARKHDVPNIRPAAFYALFTLSREGPTGYMQAAIKRLCRENAEAFMLGCMRIHQLIINVSHSSLDTDKTCCKEQLSPIIDDIRARGMKCEDPLDVLEDAFRSIKRHNRAAAKKYCSSCRNSHLETLEEFAQSLFDAFTSPFPTETDQ